MANGRSEKITTVECRDWFDVHGFCVRIVACIHQDVVEEIVVLECLIPVREG